MIRDIHGSRKCSIAVLVTFLAVAVVTDGCSRQRVEDKRVCTRSGSEGKFWGYRGRYFQVDSNFYELQEGDPEYGIVIYNVRDASDPGRYPRHVVAALELCRRDYLANYRTKTLTDPTRKFAPLNLKYIVLVLLDNNCCDKVETMSSEERPQAFCRCQKVGYVFSSGDVFGESPDYARLIINAYIHKEPIVLDKHLKRVYQIIADHKRQCAGAHNEGGKGDKSNY